MGKKKLRKKQGIKKNSKSPFSLIHVLHETVLSFREKTVAYGIVFLLAVAPLIRFNISGELDNNPKTAFLQWGIVLLAILQVNILRKSSFKWKTTPLDLPVFGFFLFCIASLVWAANPWLATMQVLVFGSGVIVYFFLIHSTRKEETIDDIFFITALSAAIVSAIGILEAQFNIGWQISIARPSSTFTNRNMAAQFIAIAVPLITGSIVVSRLLWVKISGILSLVLSIVYLVFTQTRAAWVAVLVVFAVLLCFFFFSIREKIHLFARKSIYGFVIGMVLFIVFFVSPVKNIFDLKYDFPERFTSIFTVKEGSTNLLRIIWWGNTLHMIKDNPLLGVGLNNFVVNYPPYHKAFRVDRTFSEEKQVNRIHNDHLQILAELGILGFLIYLSVFILFVFMILRLLKSTKTSPSTKQRALFLFLGVLSFAIVACFCFPFQRAVPPVYLFVILGLSGFLYNRYFPREKVVSNLRKAKTARIIVLCLLIIYFCASVVLMRKIFISDRYFVEGISYGEIGKYELSNRALQKAKIFSMWNFNITSLLGRNYAIMGKYGEALEEFEESFRANPNNTNSMLNVGYCYLKMEEYDRAEQYFKKYIDAMPRSEKGYNNLAIVYYSRGDYAKAVEHYRKAVELKPSVADTYFNLANALRAQKNYEQAVVEYKTALKLKPNFDDARQALISLYFELGEPEKARELINSSLLKHPEAAETFIAKGRELHKQGKFREAIQEYFKAFQLNPKNHNACYNIGLSYYRLNNFPEAEKYLKKSVELNPDLAEAFNLLGQIALTKNNDSEALLMFINATEKKPEMAEAHLFLGISLLRIGDHIQAIKSFEKTLELDTDNPVAHHNLGAIYRHIGENKKALKHLKKALVKPSPHIDTDMTKQLIEELEKAAKQKKGVN